MVLLLVWGNEGAGVGDGEREGWVYVFVQFVNACVILCAHMRGCARVVVVLVVVVGRWWCACDRAHIGMCVSVLVS